jgi:hypothetical protein
MPTPRRTELNLPNSNLLCHSPAFVVFTHHAGGILQRAILSGDFMADHLCFRLRELPARALSFQGGYSAAEAE